MAQMLLSAVDDRPLADVVVDGRSRRPRPLMPVVGQAVVSGNGETIFDPKRLLFAGQGYCPLAERSSSWTDR